MTDEDLLKKQSLLLGMRQEKIIIFIGNHPMDDLAQKCMVTVYQNDKGFPFKDFPISIDITGSLKLNQSALSSKKQEAIHSFFWYWTVLRGRTMHTRHMFNSLPTSYSVIFDFIYKIANGLAPWTLISDANA